MASEQYRQRGNTILPFDHALWGSDNFQSNKDWTNPNGLDKRADKALQHVQQKHQANFQPGAFASCDFFLELLLDPKRNPTRALAGLFEVVEHRQFMCGSAEPCLIPQIRSLTPIKIEMKNFLENGLEPSDVLGLIKLWTSTGISKTPGLVCRCHAIKKSTQNKPKPRGRPPKKPKDPLPEITISAEKPNHTAEYVKETSRLAFKDDLPLQHLYFFMEPSNPIEQEQYMGAMDWPYQITILGAKYTLLSCGFWNGYHYWCKVLRTGRGTTTGVWLHDDRQNDGNTQLVNTDASSIGGSHAFTSWIFYSRVWTPDEESYVNSLIAKIRSAHPDAEGDIPFIHLGNLINPEQLFLVRPSTTNTLDGEQGKQDNDPNSPAESYCVDNFKDLDGSDSDEDSELDQDGVRSRGESDPSDSEQESDASEPLVLNPVNTSAKRPLTLKLKLSQPNPNLSDANPQSPIGKSSSSNHSDHKSL
ncbi:hypothetical protein PTTG_28484 [Puccinia triticina 1-1 BBBD Race 1]|uniref:Uncharacterized protein n=1 Tax=Puccinia triticina (isolate 1-1 / race 1 (BBBD)) TaxID=630390 RepID=A0A180GB09_PUCT1|nr:hypothetical protein PTTG_28484 [Puccinia triticina 1-1 BBBD Race 1]